MNRMLIVLIILVGLVGVSAYLFMSDSGQNEDQNTSTAPTTPPAGADDTSEMIDDPNADAQVQAMEAVREEVAAELNIDPEMVDITSVEEQKWPDGCLGLPADDEMCTQAIVPGYEIQAEAEGESFTYRTNDNGTTIRAEE